VVAEAEDLIEKNFAKSSEGLTKAEFTEITT
jgi:hypothetical protein